MHLKNNLTTIYLFLLFSLISYSLFSQKKTTPFYYIENNKVKTIGRIAPYSSFKLIDKKPKFEVTKSLNTKGVIPNLIIEPITNFFVNKLADLIYKPEKFIKSNNASCLVLNEYNNKTLDIFENKSLLYTNTSKPPYKSSFVNNNLSLNFILKPYNNFKDLFYTLKLESYIYNYTNVKLKRKHFKTNILIDISISYFDQYGILKKHSLKTIQIDDATPEGKNAKLTPVKDSLGIRYIPTKFPIESINISVTEINTRKKVWDKWFKVYTDNKEKINEFILDKIETEE